VFFPDTVKSTQTVGLTTDSRAHPGFAAVPELGYGEEVTRVAWIVSCEGAEAKPEVHRETAATMNVSTMVFFIPAVSSAAEALLGHGLLHGPWWEPRPN
jgi:hypothetical protein